MIACYFSDSAAKLRRLIDDCAAAGGEGVEEANGDDVRCCCCCCARVDVVVDVRGDDVIDDECGALVVALLCAIISDGDIAAAAAAADDLSDLPDALRCAITSLLFDAVALIELLGESIAKAKIKTFYRSFEWLMRRYCLPFCRAENLSAHFLQANRLLSSK